MDHQDQDFDPYVGGGSPLQGDDLFGDGFLENYTSPKQVEENFDFDFNFLASEIPTIADRPGSPQQSQAESLGASFEDSTSNEEPQLAQVSDDQETEFSDFGLTFPAIPLPRKPIPLKVPQPQPVTQSQPVASPLPNAVDISCRNTDLGLGPQGMYDGMAFPPASQPLVVNTGSTPHQPAPLPFAQAPHLQSANPSTPVSPQGAVARVDGKKINHNRRMKHDPSNDPTELYQRVPDVPSWGSCSSVGARKPKFQYFHGGPELYPYLKYTKEDLVEFFLGYGRAGKRDLTIWIQNTPAQVNDRYQAKGNGSRCRYVDCPAKDGTILKGFLRVAFDENAALTSSGIADPFHNAGYMHLYCFEELFDLGILVHYAKRLWGFEVRIDARNLEGESRNPMSIRRDHDSMGECYSDWMKEQLQLAVRKLQRVGDPNDLSLMDAKRPSSKKDHLWYRLTDRHLELEVKGRRETREKRGGAHIARHKGDLRKYLRLKEDMNQDKKRNREADEDDGVELVHPSKRHQRHEPTSNPSRTPTFTDHAFHQLSQPQYQPQPQEHLHMLHSQHQCGSPRTRKRSKETEDCIRQVLTTSQHLTRRSTYEIVDLLEDTPEHVRNRVLAAVPEHADGVLLAGQGSRVLYHDHLEERIQRLPKRQRRDVSGYTEAQETLKDPRKLHSV